ncbi:BlaI/MecI/CopY family transcriptional regulator [Thermococcus sp.]
MKPHEFKLTEEGIRAVLPPLEAEVMEHMWKVYVATAGQVYEELKKKHPEIRRSTVSIVMNRLCEKGLLKRSVERGRGGMRYVYAITTTKEEFEQKVVQSILEALINNFREATYAYLSRIKK